MNFLESTAMSIETYNERQRRRESFMAGMETGTPAMETIIKSQLTATTRILHVEFCHYENMDQASIRPQYFTQTTMLHILVNVIFHC